MAASAVKVLVVNGKEITQSVDLRTTKQGSATKVKAIKGGKFILADADTGAAPENITAHRVGNNLHVSLEGTGYDDPELIIEDYYSQDGQGELVGVAEDGAYYQFIASDAEAAHESVALGDNVTSPLVLGGQQLVGFGAGLVPAAGFSWLGLGLFGLGALGLIGAALANDGGNGGGGTPGDNEGPGGSNPGDGGGSNPGDGGGSNPGDGGGPNKPGTPTIGEIDDNTEPHTGPIPDGGVTNDNQPVLIGTGDPGDIITIIDNGKPIGSTIVDDDGNWTFKPDTPLDDGDHDIIVIGKDPDGNESDPSPPHTIIVDTTPPNAPVIDGADDNVGVTGPIPNNGITDDAQPVLHGTAEANSVVSIYDGTTLLGSTQVDGNGNWTFQPPTPLFIGDHQFTAVATDAAGNVSVPSNEFDLSLLVGGAPSAPAITGVIDHVEPHIGAIPENGITNDAEPTIQGTAKAGSLVTVHDTDGSVIGSVNADATGHWEITPTTPLADGLHNITATATEGGVVSAPTAAYPINVDTSIPAAPVIDDTSSLIDHVGAVTGPIPNNGTTDDSEPEFRGTALPNAIVTIYDNGVVIGSTTSDANGDWDFYPTTPLPDGPHVFSATATNAAGNTSVPSAPINFIVDTSGVAIAITGVIDNEGPITGPISRDGVTDDPRPQIVGTATANSLVMVYDNGTLIGSTTANAQGRWTLDPSADLPEGMNAITATSTNTATGVVSDPTAPFNFNLDTHIPVAPVIEGADDNVGAITGPIANHGSTDDSTPTLHGTAEPHSIVTIYDGALVLGSAQVDGAGNWIFTPTTPLSDGPHDFTATATDAAGKTGPASNDWAVNIDTGVPLAPTIGEIDDNTAPHTGPIPDGGVTNDPRPVLVGTGTPGDIVTIIDNGTPIGSAQVGNDGNWTFQPPTPLPEGDHDFTVIETNPVGSVSDPSPPHSIIVDLTALAPVITNVVDNSGATTTDIVNGGSTDDTTPQIRGTGEPGAVVTLYEGNGAIGTTVVGSAKVGADGVWTIDVNAPVGNHTYTATQVDVAGNDSPLSAAYGINVLAPLPTTLTEDFSDIGYVGWQGDSGPHDFTSADGYINFTATPATSSFAWTDGIVGPGFDNTYGNKFDAGGTDLSGIPAPMIMTTGSVVAKIADGGSATGASFDLFANIANGTTYLGGSVIQFLDSSGNVVYSQAVSHNSPSGFVHIDVPGVTFSTIVLTVGTIRFDADGEIGPDHVGLTNLVITGAIFPPGTVALGIESIVSDDVMGLESVHNGTEADDQDAITQGKDEVAAQATVVADQDIAAVQDVAVDQNVAAVQEVNGNQTNGGDLAAVSEQSFTVQHDVQVHVEQAGTSPILVLEGANQVLDLSVLSEAEQVQVGDAKIIDITGTGDNTLNLSLADVLEQGGKGLFIDDGKTQMMVKGDAGDVVNLNDLLEGANAEGDWTQAAGAVTVEGVAYNVFQHSNLDAELLVQQGVTTNLS